MSTQPEQTQPLPPDTFTGTSDVGQPAGAAFAVPVEPLTEPLEPLPVTMTQADPHPADVIYGIRATAIGTGTSTIPFPAVRDEAPMQPACHCDLCEWARDVAGGYDGECRCDACRYGQRPGADAVLYSGPDTVRMLIRAAVRDGRYEDIPAYADAALARAHLSLNDAVRRIRRNMEHAVLRVGPERVAWWTAELRRQAEERAA